MICPPCKRAGGHNRMANEAITRALRETRQIEANYHHGRCEAPTTCSCQHVVGMVVRT